MTSSPSISPAVQLYRTEKEKRQLRLAGGTLPPDLLREVQSAVFDKPSKELTLTGRPSRLNTESGLADKVRTAWKSCTLRQMARRWKVSPMTVRKWGERLGLPPMPKGNQITKRAK